MTTAAPAWAVSGYTCDSGSVPGASASDNACFQVCNETVSYVVPKGVTSMRVSLDGAGGGAHNGAAGGRTVATVAVTPGGTLSLTAGAAGVLGAKRWNVGGGGPGSNGSRDGGGKGGGSTCQRTTGGQDSDYGGGGGSGYVGGPGVTDATTSHGNGSARG
ncbi:MULTISPECIES: hypothetical protein [unclassified Streptomyces]|uniref:hypothetical protein n=1 Tax=unclassified Streptomyces TaxID=2593676 RepID=UPI00278BFB4F|nr:MULTISPECIES: hypothetical protein [unclassified Streptomyces]